MKHSPRMALLVSATVIVAFAAVVSLFGSLGLPKQGFPIFSSREQALPSLFWGLPVDARVKTIVGKHPQIPACQLNKVSGGTDGAIGDKLLSLLSITVVHPHANCGCEDCACGQHHMYPDTVSCPELCNGGFYTVFSANSDNPAPYPVSASKKVTV